MLGGPAQASAGFEWLKPGAGEFPNTHAEAADIEPGGVATNDATGDVYSTDNLKNRVLRFDAQGEFLESWGWGVGDGEEDLSAADRVDPAFTTCHGVEGTKEGAYGGPGIGELDTPNSIAVDQATGDVFVMSVTRKPLQIQEFSPEGTRSPNSGKGGPGKARSAKCRTEASLSTPKVTSLWWSRDSESPHMSRSSNR